MEQKRALVTGGARGLGRAAALELARRGTTVAVADRRIDEARETAAECEQIGVAAVAIELEQTDYKSASECVERAARELGGLDMVFANAGIGKFRPFIDLSPDEWRLTMDVNLNGTFYVCQAASRVMIREGRGGAFVLTASSGAEFVADQLSAYCVSKAGVVMLMKQMASELGPYRIRVTAIMPGVIETPMTSSMLREDKWRRMVERQTPMGRGGTPVDVAKVVAFLLSEDAAYVNGTTILIDGGSTLHGYPRWFSLDYSRENESNWESLFSEYPYAAQGSYAPAD